MNVFCNSVTIMNVFQRCVLGATQVLLLIMINNTATTTTTTTVVNNNTVLLYAIVIFVDVSIAVLCAGNSY